VENTRWEQAQSLFHQAAALPEAEWREFLDRACGNDVEMHAEVVAMLKADSGGRSILDDGLPVIAERIIGSRSELDAVREIGPYKLVRILGEGGMGVVWLAEREDTGQQVAVKLLLGAGFSPARRERFTREIKTLAKLKHPYIARLYDAGTLPDGTPWFAMEYVEGKRLTDYVRERGIPLDTVLRLFREICEAVQHAHSQEIIHRDLKPSNILVERDGTPRLLDFGIARELQGLDESWEQTRPGLRFLSPHYAAPEWARDGTVGFFTDVYSLGVILYELLTGRLPFAKLGADAVPDFGGLDQSPEKPSAVAGSASSLSNAAWSDLDVFCLKALRSDPKERYPSVEALLRDLNHYLRNEPLEARPDSFGYRLGKFIRRNRRPVFAAAATFALIAGMIVFFTLRLTKARDAALAESARKQHIQDFMLTLFGSSEKSAAPSSELRAVTLLDRGVEKANALNSDPETQIELYKTLGRMYNMLGNSAKAYELLGLALEKEKVAHGTDTVPVADLLVMRGIVLADQGRFKEGEQSAREAYALASRLLPPNDPEMMYIRAGLGHIISEEGLYLEAVDYLSPLVDWKPENDDQAQSLSTSLSALAVAQYSLGNYQEAEATNRRALELDRRIFGERHPHVGGDLWNIALNEAAQFRYAEAEKYYRQAIVIMEGWNGKEHPETAAVKGALARTLIAEGREDEAYPILQEALPIMNRAYGGKDFQIAVTLDGLGRIEAARGNLQAAESDFTRAAEMDQSLFGDSNYQTAMMKADLGDIYTRELQPQRGEPLLRSAVVVLKQRLRPADGRVVRAEELWGHSLLSLKRPSEAIEPLTAAYQALAARPAPPGQGNRRCPARPAGCLRCAE
jgi:serine/threonine protein kinase/tetratricopeptide (TPR) repeat protein